MINPVCAGGNFQGLNSEKCKNNHQKPYFFSS